MTALLCNDPEFRAGTSNSQLAFVCHEVCLREPHTVDWHVQSHRTFLTAPLNFRNHPDVGSGLSSTVLACACVGLAEAAVGG